MPTSPYCNGLQECDGFLIFFVSFFSFLSLSLNCCHFEGRKLPFLSVIDFITFISPVWSFLFWTFFVNTDIYYFRSLSHNSVHYNQLYIPSLPLTHSFHQSNYLPGFTPLIIIFTVCMHQQFFNLAFLYLFQTSVILTGQQGQLASVSVLFCNVISVSIL